jgi:phosphate transport system substrate-binding protein
LLDHFYEENETMGRFTGLAITAVLSAATLGCGGSGGNGGGGEGGGGANVKLQGAGASFPAPLYESWFKMYSQQTPGITVDYQSVGSGAGVKDFTNHLVDFGASDAAMKDEEIDAVPEGVVLLPMTAGSVVLAYNLPDGPAELNLSREAYTKIFLGQITKWNDPVIAKANPGASFPDLDITVVTRADGSGTTFVYTQHLSAISEDFANGPGIGKTVSWNESFVQAPKNDGVTAQIKQIPGAIGYIEFGFAMSAGLPMAKLENKAGKYVEPTLESCSASLAGVEMPEDLRAWLPDPDGDGSYPIVTYTWLLCYQKYDDADKVAALKELVKYCLTEGQKISGEMGYIPLPKNVVEKVLAASETIE